MSKQSLVVAEPLVNDHFVPLAFDLRLNEQDDLKLIDDSKDILAFTEPGGMSVSEEAGVNKESPRLKNQEYVAFFAHGQIVEMVNLDQFEDILEGMHPVPGRSRRNGRAVYMIANAKGMVLSMVFFKVPVDEAGNCLESWRLPLQRLAETAVLGPDLGGSRVTLASFSQCPISWHRDSLWDPTQDDFRIVQKAVEARAESAKVRHHLVTASEEDLMPEVVQEVDEGIPTLGSTSTKAAKPQPKAPLSAQANTAKPAAPVSRPASPKTAVAPPQKPKVKPATVGLPDEMLVGLDDDDDDYFSDLDDEAFEQDLERTMRNERQAYRNQIQELQQEVERQRTLNERMQRRLLEGGLTKDEDQGKLNAQIAEMGERMKRLVVQIEALEEENQQLQQEVDELIEINTGGGSLSGEGGGTDIIEQIKRHGLVSMAYHPGVGHLNLEADEILSYLKDPVEYVARNLDISREHYLLWLQHDREGRCTQCGCSLEREPDPKAFVPGFTDRCREHQA
jgi:hypothetical protein